MEVLDSKLNSGTPVLISQIISKLVESIKSKRVNDLLEIAEYKFLKEKCLNGDCAVNVVAASAILSLARDGSPSLVKNMITDFVTIITTTKYSSNVTLLINNLLLIDLQNEFSTNNLYKCSFNLRLPQHPFIIMLNENPSSWFQIFKEITFCYKTANTEIQSHCNKLYKPVFLYTLCNPNGSHLVAFKLKLWTLLIHTETTDIISTLLMWMQFECGDTVEINSELLIELSYLNPERNIIDPNILLLCQISTLQKLITNNLDPRAMIFSVLNTLECHESLIVLNPVLLILAKSITSCSSVYLSQLLQLCKVIIYQTKYDAVTKNIVKHSLLQWIANPSSLISDAVKQANTLFSFLEKNTVCSSHIKDFVKFCEHFEQFIITNSDIYTAKQLYILLQNWKNDEDILIWLTKLQNVPIFFTVKIVDFLFGLFLTNFDEPDINLKVFELILKCVGYKKILAANVLTAILYRLTNTTDSKLHYQLLKAVPRMAVVKDNMQKIVSTIQALSKGGSTLRTFSTTLMLDLWKIDHKCYSCLENLLISPYASQGNRWEFYVTRAYVLKELCALKPELYGKEMVAHISKILNECNNADGALASALAIEGITHLCKSEIIDAVTTWATLAPMFKNETRVPVIKSVCTLISEIPNLSYTEAYPQLIEEVVAKLWEYTVMNPDDEVWTAALSALTHFNLEQIVAQAPDKYFDEETLSMSENDHVVAGHCWIYFLKNCSESKLAIAGDFLIKMVSLEVSSYLKFVYQVKGPREPANHSYLPVNSVVRGLSTYIKSKIMKWKGSPYKEVYLQCLRIFSQEYSKPLPPLDWCFLQELVHEPEAKDYCVSIAARQVVLSGTARRFIVNYIEAIAQNHTNEHDVLHVYSNLRHLGNSVQPFALKPFLEVTILNAVELFKVGSKDQLVTILRHLEDTLRDETIQEANKIVIAQIISDVFNQTEICCELFEMLLECVILFPVKCINDMSSPKSMKEVRTEWLKKAIRIRCHLAVNSSDAALNWLNDLVESGSSFPA
jgi:hypothetical protein